MSHGEIGGNLSPELFRRDKHCSVVTVQPANTNQINYVSLTHTARVVMPHSCALRAMKLVLFLDVSMFF